MRSVSGLVCGCFAGVVLLIGLASAQKEPLPQPVMFGAGPGRNLVNETAKNIPGEWNITKGEQKNVKWQAQLGNTAYGGPVVAEGKVFVGTNNERPRDPAVKGDRGVVMCFDAKTGQFLWQNAYEKLDESIDFPTTGIASSPAVDNGKVYYVTNRCQLVCVDAAKGKELWSIDMIKDYKVYPGAIPGGLANCSPLLVEDLVIVNTSNGVDAETKKPKNPMAPTLIAADKNTGKVIWTDNSPGNDILDGQWTNPAAAKIDGKWQVIFGGGDGWVRGHDAKTGKLLWKFDCNPKGLAFNPNKRESKNYIVATPVVYDNKVYVTMGMEPDNCSGVGALWCIDPTKKPTNKELNLSPVDNDFDPKSPKNKDSGLVWYHGGAIVPKPAGNLRQYHFGRTLSTVAIHDGLVFAAEYTGYLQCLDAATGKKFWEFDLKDAVWSSPYYVDGKVFIGTESGELYVFEATKVLKEPVQFSMEQTLKTPPVVADGVLYITNGLYLYAIQGK